MHWFLDGSHYTPAAGQVIMARVMGTPEAPDVAREMAQLRTLTDQYFSAHPDERVETDAAAADARRACKG